MAGFVAEVNVVFSAVDDPVSLLYAAIQNSDSGRALLALRIIGLRRDQVTLSVSYAKDTTSIAPFSIDVLRTVALNVRHACRQIHVCFCWLYNELTEH